MSDVTGPISSLPGAHHTLPVGAMCDEHPDRPAVARIQGETDSFGCEMHDLCEECARELRAAIAANTHGVCEWCNQEAADLRNHRDFEEGSCGRVYRVCGTCRKREADQLEAESGWSDWDDFADFESATTSEGAKE